MPRKFENGYDEEDSRNDDNYLDEGRVIVGRKSAGRVAKTSARKGNLPPQADREQDAPSGGQRRRSMKRRLSGANAT